MKLRILTSQSIPSRLYCSTEALSGVYPKATKSAFHTIEAMQHFAGATDKPACFYCDNAPELIASARACKWRIATATTGIPQTSGVAERSVRTDKEGGGCGIAQSGYNPKWWPEVGEALL